MTSTALPASASAEHAVDLALGAHVDAPRRLVENDHVAAGMKPLASTTFCWLPPERLDTGASMLAAFSLRLAPSSPTRRRSDGAPQEAETVHDRRQPRHRRIDANGRVEHDALQLAILRHEADPGFDGVLRRTQSDFLAVEGDRPALEPIAPKITRATSLRPEPDKPAEPDNFAGAQREADVARPDGPRADHAPEPRLADLRKAPSRGTAPPSARPTIMRMASSIVSSAAAFVPTTWPSFITVTRSAICRISSSRCEM